MSPIWSISRLLTDQMIARGYLRRLPRGVDVLLADGAVCTAQVLDALQQRKEVQNLSEIRPLLNNNNNKKKTIRC